MEACGGPVPSGATDCWPAATRTLRDASEQCSGLCVLMLGSLVGALAVRSAASWVVRGMAADAVHDEVKAAVSASFLDGLVTLAIILTTALVAPLLLDPSSARLAVAIVYTVTAVRGFLKFISLASIGWNIISTHGGSLQSYIAEQLRSKMGWLDWLLNAADDAAEEAVEVVVASTVIRWGAGAIMLVGVFRFASASVLLSEPSSLDSMSAVQQFFSPFATSIRIILERLM